MLIAGITCACKSRQNARGISSEWCITPTIKQERGEQNIKKKRKKRKNQKYSAPSDASLLQPREKEEEKKQKFQKKFEGGPCQRALRSQ